MNEQTAIQTVETPTAVDAGNVRQINPIHNVIERIAMSPDADLGKLERMLAMQERIWAREARQAFDNAMADAKAEIPPIIKTGTVDYLNSKKERTYFKHETNDGIAKVVDPILAKHGLSYRYRSDQNDGLLHVTCVVSHRGGYSEETTLKGSPDASGSKNNYQAIGSAVTYLQRYTLKLALGLSAAKDDDSMATNRSETISADQFVALNNLIEDSSADRNKLCVYFKIDILENLPAAQFGHAEAMLRKKLKETA